MPRDFNNMYNLEVDIEGSEAKKNNFDNEKPPYGEIESKKVYSSGKGFSPEKIKHVAETYFKLLPLLEELSERLLNSDVTYE